MPRNSLLKVLRLIHLYFGVFITPALLFFALTGALQTFGLHETNRDHPNYKPAHWITVLAQIHKKQTAILPVRRPPAPAAASSASKPDQPPAKTDHRAEPATPTPTTHPLPLRIFFLAVCVGLLTSTLTGLYMSFTYSRNKLPVVLSLATGVVIPIALIFI